MKITKIARQTKNKERYSIFIDEEFAFGVSEQVLIKFALTKNQSLTQDEIDAIKAAEATEYLFNKALSYLSYGLRTKKEMTQYLIKQLKDNGLNDHEIEDQKEDIDKTILRLVDLNLMDDLSYAEAYVRTKANINRKGPQVIQQELMTKGITKETVEKALEQYSIEEQSDNIEHLAEKFIRSNQKYPLKALKLRLQQHLMLKGFDKELVMEWMNAFSFDSLDNDEDALIKNEAEKIMRRRQAKFQGRELEQKVKEGLYRKGFDFETIQSWINNHKEKFDVLSE